MPPVHTPSQDPWDLVRALERRVAELENRSLANAVISQGDLTVDGGEFTIRHPTGGWLAHFGVGSQGKYFFTLRRDDGTPAIELGTVDAGHQFVSLWDRSGNVVVADDANSGTGLARPWIPLPGIPVATASMPSTTSGTYTAVWSTGFPTKQQPFVSLSALLLSNSAATGNARFTLNGNPVGSVMPIAANAFGWQTAQMIPLPGKVDDLMQIELQLQRTNAVGSVAGVFMGYQRQS